MNAMMDLGPHAGFIWAAYGVAALVLGALMAWIQFDARRQRQLLVDLEAKGITRRSARKPAGPGKGTSQ